MTLYKHPQCGCCEAYAGYLRENGFTVTVMATHELATMSRDTSIPAGVIDREGVQGEDVYFKRLSVLVIATLAFAMPAVAHHPGADLDKVMGSREQFFQAIDSPARPFELADADGNIVKLSDFADRIVVLNFIFAGCTDVCALQSALIADVQSKINVTPMKDMVRFITVTTDPEIDTADILKSYGKAHGLDPHNWMFVTRLPGDLEDTTRALSETYNVKFKPLDDGQQMHGVVTHVIDRGGRFAAKFHGLRFEPLNLVLYINGLTNAPSGPSRPAETGWWDSVKGLFR